MCVCVEWIVCFRAGPVSKQNQMSHCLIVDIKPTIQHICAGRLSPQTWFCPFSLWKCENWSLRMFDSLPNIRAQMTLYPNVLNGENKSQSKRKRVKWSEAAKQSANELCWLLTFEISQEKKNKRNEKQTQTVARDSGTFFCTNNFNL